MYILMDLESYKQSIWGGNKVIKKFLKMFRQL